MCYETIEREFPTLGSQLIDELARRGFRGSFFCFADYRELRRIDVPENLVEFLASRRFSISDASIDIAEVVDRLAEIAESRTRWLKLALMLVDPWMLLSDHDQPLDAHASATPLTFTLRFLTRSRYSVATLLAVSRT